MKHVIIAVLLSLTALTAHAESSTAQNEESCTNPQFEQQRLINGKSCIQSESESAVQNASLEGNDLVNSAQAQINTKTKANVLAGLGTLQRYLSRTEKAFATSKITYPQIQNCTSLYNATPIWNHLPCDPNPVLAKVINTEFKRLGWPSINTASEAYQWIINEYPTATENEQRAFRQFAQINATQILSLGMLANTRQLDIYDQQAKALTKRVDSIQQHRDTERTVIGNITTIGTRAVDTVTTLFTNTAVLLGMLLIGRRYLPKPKQKIALVNIGYFTLTSVPFAAFYIPFGGWFDAVTAWIPSGVRMILVILVFVPAFVAVRRYAPRYLGRFLSGFSKSQPAQKTNGIHGSAHWSTTADAINKGHYQKAGDSLGLALGRPLPNDMANMEGMDFRFRHIGHMLTCAPTGCGKGIGAVIPNLLDYPGSCVVLDIKGENYAVTARYRREVLGHDIHLIDPFGVTGHQSSGINWLDRLNPESPDVVGESAALADMLVMSEGSKSDSSDHFNETAKTFLRGVLVHVASLPDPLRSMGEVRRLLTGNMEEFAALLLDMEQNPKGHGIPTRAVNSLLATPEKERGSILSTVRRHLDFLDDPRIVQSLSSSDLNLDDLKRKPMTIYLVMPPARLEANKRYIRAFIGQCLSAITNSSEKPLYRVAFLLDEFAQLGRMQAVEDAISLIRGYGAIFWLFVQDLSQLKAVYPKWQTFLANTGKQFFGTADYDTAKFISDSLGKHTIEYQTQGNSSSIGTASLNRSTGSSENQQFTARDLLTPDEIMRLPAERPIVMLNGEAPYILQRLNYLTDAEYIGMFDHNPYH